MIIFIKCPSNLFLIHFRILKQNIELFEKTMLFMYGVCAN